MSKPDDIPQDVWGEAVSALESAWDEHADHFNPLSNTVSEGLWQRFFEAAARTILAERMRCAKVADRRLCPDTADAIRKGD